MGMRKNTRNLIRRAEKEDVEIISGDSCNLIDVFMKMYRETAKKHSFVPFSEKYIRGEINSFTADKHGYAKIYLAKYKEVYIAGAAIVFWGHSAYYHHGASAALYGKIPSSYLLQWQAIKDAKKAGKKFYNFWGIAKNENDKNNPWYGLTFFKKGFGGERTDYLRAQDLPLNKKYFVNFAIEKYRLWKRGV
jgi:lipid II:glycine glycyltransferase (peptidoglycan interpeptide bridge formation enzyme)